MRNRWKGTGVLIGALLIVAPQARSQIDYSATVVGGGAVEGTNGAQLIRGTIAQAAVGRCFSASLETSLGFWHAMRRMSVSDAREIPTTGSATTTLDASPNPFSGSTQVSLRIPHAEHISLVLYDLLGKPARTLFDAEHPGGELSFGLSVDDLPSGRYTLVLSADDERRTLPLLLVR